MQTWCLLWWITTHKQVSRVNEFFMVHRSEQKTMAVWNCWKRMKKSSIKRHFKIGCNNVKSTWFVDEELKLANPHRYGPLRHTDFDTAWYVCADNRLFESLGGLTLGLWIHGSRTWDASAPGKKCLEGIFNLSEWRSGAKCICEEEMMVRFTTTWRLLVGLRNGGKGEREREGGVKATKWCKPQMGGGTRAKKHMDWERHGGGGKKGRKKVGKTNWKNRGERFSIPPLPALRLSLAVLIHGFLGL